MTRINSERMINFCIHNRSDKLKGRLVKIRVDRLISLINHLEHLLIPEILLKMLETSIQLSHLDEKNDRFFITFFGKIYILYMFYICFYISFLCLNITKYC